MKKILTLLASLILLNIGGFYTEVSADSPVMVKVGIYENRPKIFTDDQRNAAGFWPDIINYIAAKEGWEIEYVPGTWMQCLERLEKNEIDMMPDVAYTEDRDRIFDFSQETVYVSWSRVYAGVDSNIQSILDLEGKNIAVLEGSVNVEGPDGIKKLTEAFNINCTFIAVDSYVKVFELVDKKEADAGLASKDFAYSHQAGYNVVETSIVFQPARLYFAFPPESTLKPYLIERIDNDVKELKADGDSIYYQSLKEWLGVEPIEKPVIPDWAKWMLIGIGILVLLFGGGNFILRTQVRKRTKELAEDITKREQTEKELRESEEKLRKIFETVPEGIALSDTNGVIIGVNQAIVDMHGYNNKDEIIGKTGLDLIAEKDRGKAQEYFGSLTEKGKVRNFECSLLNKNGNEFPAELSAAVLKDNADKPIGIIAVTIDITARMQAEEEHKKVIEYRELDKLRTSLLSTVSHELRTPLAGIKGYVTLLLDYFNKLKTAQKWESLEAIDQSTDRLTELIEHLLDMSRLDAGLLRLDLQPIEPQNIFLTAVEEAKLRSPKYRFKTKVAARMPIVTADAKRLRQVIDNLLDNAVKYSNEGTEIVVQTEVKQGELLVGVADQGRGIPATEIKKIFDRFYRIEERLEKDPGGLGLGLSLCKALVEAHGGKIWVESQVGEGSTFYFVIPLKGNKKSE